MGCHGLAGGPFGGLAEERELGGDVGADGVLEGDDFVQDPESVLAHFFAGEDFGQVGRKVQSELHGPSRDGDAQSPEGH